MPTKLTLRISFLFLATIAATSALFAQSTPKESLLILSKHDHTVAIIDPATLKVAAKAPIGDDPHEVIASSDGKTAYISNYGGGGAGALHTLAVVDLVAQKPLAPLDLLALRGPPRLHFAARQLWFTAGAPQGFRSYEP